MAAVAFLQSVKGRRLLDDFLKATLGGSGPVPPDEQRNLADPGNVLEKIYEPYFADEAGNANKQDVPISERFSNRQAVDARHVAKRRDTPACGRYGAGRGLRR